MRCLGIETSCDETALAIVENGKLVDAVMTTQAEVHALFGGVVPELASREHYRLIARMFDALMERCNLSYQDIDVVSVARGPGLLGSLLVGVGFAKGLVLAGGQRLIGVNHLHAHLLAAGLEQKLQFPALGLLVSGGHTHLYLVESPREFRLIGRTLDDAAGEAFDKVAKMLNLPYPGGRFIDVLGNMVEPDAKMFPRPYVDNDNLDFSFSGLKTAVGSWLNSHPSVALQFPLAEEQADSLLCERRLPENVAEDLPLVCASFNAAVADTLYIKTKRALGQLRSEGCEVRSVIVAGGVAANSRIRSSIAGLADEAGLVLHLPSFGLCTDNGAMIAYTGWLLAVQGLCHGLDLETMPRGRVIPDDYRMYSF
ncbi:tRNA (adenosine(37)-N6)-threonylcarbamoyltransferase complex transferase subunit TsaD [Oleidesulfovibrio sp.]|uniref:tRNA (adenosine(37)-N6)-threonylcarbamoyltransferase complex transferase subunit TsaD n=1 Tax=Oleidesulfovibrio sp. TaxID=2909707 RepID=UPI003A8689E8